MILIDGNAILHRAYHALPPLTSKDGEPINAVYGFVSMLAKVITDLKPSHLIVCLDTAKPTFRHVAYVGYQAQRPRTDSELSSQFEVAREIVKAAAIPLYAVEGYEADDLIGTLAKQAEDKVGQVIVVTGDRDILQLVNNKVKVYMPIKGLTDAKMFATEDVVERMGVAPEKIIDYKALVGDPSDNYPGVPGIGPKTAVELISKYKSLEEIFKNLGEIPERTSKKLAEGAESAGLSKHLATIALDAPVTLDLEKAGDWNIKSKALLELFEKIGFKTLAERVKKVGEQVDKEKQIGLF